MGSNIASKCGKDSSMFQNIFLQEFLIYPSYKKQGWMKYLMAGYFLNLLFLCINLNYIKIFIILLFGYLHLVFFLVS
jgi:hypothetical protein